jgi:hypothetical protein
MSTIYTFHAECSTMDTIAATDRFLVYDVSTGRTEYCLASDIQAYIDTSPGTLSSPVINTATLNGVFSVSTSVVFGSTLSAKIGFFGKAGTSAATTIAALTTTMTAASCGVGFSTSANYFSMISAVNSLISVLQDAGIVKA